MSNLGIGAMLGWLSGNEETVKAHLKAQGKIISEIQFSEKALEVTAETVKFIGGGSKESEPQDAPDQEYPF